MNKKILTILLLNISLLLTSCNNEAEEEYNAIPTSPVTVDLTQVPYPKLSD